MLSDDRVILRVQTSTDQISSQHARLRPQVQTSSIDMNGSIYLPKRELPRNVTRVLCRRVEEAVEADTKRREKQNKSTSRPSSVGTPYLRLCVLYKVGVYPVPAALSILITTFLAFPYRINPARDHRVRHRVSAVYPLFEVL